MSTSPISPSNDRQQRRHITHWGKLRSDASCRDGWNHNLLPGRDDELKVKAASLSLHYKKRCSDHVIGARRKKIQTGSNENPLHP
jgi:hypothetical protein